MSPDLIVYQISRARVARLDCSHVVAQFDPRRMSADDMRTHYGRVVFCFEGYDEHPQELYAIPAVRRFVRCWHETDPGWLFFGSLHEDGLKILYLALLDDCVSVQLADQVECQVSFSASALAQLVIADLARAGALLERAGLGPLEGTRRTAAVLAYFGMEGGPE